MVHRHKIDDPGIFKFISLFAKSYNFFVKIHNNPSPKGRCNFSWTRAISKYTNLQVKDKKRKIFFSNCIFFQNVAEIQSCGETVGE